MQLRMVFPILLAFATGISEGRVVTGCNDPLWTVVGNHYVPKGECKQTFTLQHHQINAFREKYFKILSEGQSSPDERKINDILDGLVKLLEAEAQGSIMDTLQCVACAVGIKTYEYLSSAGVSDETILKVLDKICIDLNIMTPKICTGALNLYGNTLMTIVKKAQMSPNHICSVLLNKKCGPKPLPELEWNVTFPNTTKPPLQKPVPPPPKSPKLKVLHITDTHWDTQYQVGSWAECKLPLCCRKENVLPDANATAAGKYGGWKCDSPEETFDSMLQHIAKTHPDLDYILWTGDIPAHDIWEQTRADNLNVLKRTVAKLSATFPKTPMFPALGNHESVPSNMFPTSKGPANPMDWLYDEVSTQWSRWLPKNVSQTVRNGAFYTTMIRPGLRLVSMNMNYCYKMNWWLVDNSKDPLDELQWFVNLLTEAEKKKEKVHVIGHIPPGGSDCLRMWQTNFYNIINRFEGTVTAQFYGHTHSDEYEVLYDMKNTNRPFGVAYIAPSLTTYTYHNPAYRIYYVEGDYENTGRYVLDHETWYLDLEKANKLNQAEWKKLYSAKDAYKMKNLYPEDWNELYLRIKNSDETLQLYHKYFWNDSPKRPDCGDQCRLNRLCGIRSCDLYGYPDD